MEKAKATCTCETCGATFTRERVCSNKPQAMRWEKWTEEHFTECGDCFWARMKARFAAKDALNATAETAYSMSFRGKRWERVGNSYSLIGTTVRVYQWNTGKNANFLVDAGTRVSHSISKTITGKGQEARDRAIAFALSIADEYQTIG